jgi:hypothetical protein
MDDQAFNAYLNNVKANAASSVQQPQAPMQQPAQQPQQQGGGGNWFTHLLPTAGGILGGIVGIPGDLISGGAASVAGAGAGSAIGKGIENAFEGKNPLSSSDLTAGAEGAIGQGVGGLIGKGLGTGAKLLEGRATGIENAAKTAENAAADQTAVKAQATALKDVNPTLQGNLNAKDSLQHVTDMGFDPTKAADLQTVSNNTNDVLNSTLDKALANSGPVDLSHYPQLIKDALAKQSDVLDSYEPVGISKGRLGTPNTPAGKLLGAMENLGMGKATINSDPNVIRTLTTKLGGMAQKYQGVDTPEAKAAYDAINEVRGNVKNTLYDRPEVNDALQNLEGNITPKDVGTQQLADHINNVLTTAGANGGTPAQDILSEISRNIDINRLGAEMNKAGQIVSSTGGQARALGELPAVEQPVQGTNPLQVASDAHNANGVIGTALAVGKHAANSPTLLNTLSRMGALTGKIAPTAGVIAANAANMGAAPVAATGQQGGTMGAAMQQQQNPLDQLYQTLLQNYQASGGITPNDASIAGTLQTLAPQVQKQNLVAGELSAIPGQFANAGGAQGTGGILSRISGLIPGTAANNYQNDQTGAAQALASQLGISPQAAMGLLPQLMNNQGTAGQNQGVLSQLTGQLAY